MDSLLLASSSLDDVLVVAVAASRLQVGYEEGNLEAR